MIKLENNEHCAQHKFPFHGRSKIQLHVELNAAYSVLLGLCLELDLEAYHEKLLNGRTFMSSQVDHSSLPSV